MEKLAAMERADIRIMGEEKAKLPPLAWPQQVVKEKEKNQVVGIVMPMVNRQRTVPIAHTLTPTTRKNVLVKHGTNEEDFKKTRWAMARNLINIVPRPAQGGMHHRGRERREHPHQSLQRRDQHRRLRRIPGHGL